MHGFFSSEEPNLDLAAGANRLLVFLLTLSTLLQPAPVSAPAANFPIHFDHISTDQGLSTPDTWSVLRDAQGFIWIGTQDGLNRYDGYQMKVFRHNNDVPGSLSENTIRTLYLDHAGTLWVGTWNGGLNRYDRGTETFTHYQHDSEKTNTLSNDGVFTILEDRAGTLWLGTHGGGLNRFDPQTETFTSYQHDPGNPASLLNDNIYALLEDDSGALWIGTDGGLDRFDPARGTFTPYLHDSNDPGSLSDNAVRALYEDNRGWLWVGTISGGLDRLALRPALSSMEGQVGVSGAQSKAFTHYQNDPQDPHSLSDDNVLSILQDPGGLLWVGTYNHGLNLLDPNLGTFTRYAPNQAAAHGFGGSSVLDMFLGTSALWFATGDGVYQLNLQPKPFHNLRHDSSDPNSLGSDEINAVYEDHQGILWVATKNSGLDRVDRQTGQVTHYLHIPEDPASLSFDNIRSIAPSQDGSLWLATYGGGLDKFNPLTGKSIHYRHDPEDAASLGSDLTTCVFEDADGLVWVGTYDAGVDRFAPDQETFTHFRSDLAAPHKLSDNSVVLIYADHSGMLWIGTATGGLNRYDRGTGTITFYQHNRQDPDSLSSNNISAVLQDSRGVLWVGTWNEGLNRMKPDMTGFSHYYPSHGLGSESVYGILADDQGYLWLSSTHGLSKFDPQDGSFRNYDQADGLPGISFDQGAAYRSSSGEMFFGSTSGLTAFYPDQIQDQLAPPPVVITNFLLANRPVPIGSDSVLQRAIDETKDLALSYQDRVITFEFAALNYISPQKNRYRYQLVGFDKRWIEVDSAHRFATYTNLDPGQYIFRVLGSNNDGIWNEVGTSLHITITPPWWVTIWFRAAIGMLLVGLVAVGFVWQRGRAARREQKLEALVAERTQELQDARTQISTLFNSSPLGISLSTVDGAILGANRALQRITGYSEDELLKTNIKQLYADPEQRPQVLEQLGASGNLQDYGIKLQRRDGSFYYASLNLSTLERSGQEMLLAVIDDVSDQVEVREALATLHDISHDISTIAELPDLLNHALQDLYMIVDFQRAALMLVEDGGETLTIHVYDSPTAPPGLTLSQVPISSFPSLRAVLSQRETTYVPDMRVIPSIQTELDDIHTEWWAAALKASRSWLSLPLLVRERTLGLLNLLHGEANRYDASDIDLARTFANQFAVACDNIHLNEQARLLATADERSRIARELHDSVTQTLFAASVLAEATPRIWDKDQEIARRNMEKLSVLMRGALAEMRSLLLELRSDDLYDQPLGQLLTTLAEAARARTRAAITLSLQDGLALPEDVTLTFYRIGREALNNVINHAEATQINISLFGKPDRVELHIQDDGLGFDPQGVPDRHLGIRIMGERAAQIGADLQINSESGYGTEVAITWSSKGGRLENHD
jgi:PAS domain S-box-containing protein